MRTSHDEEVTRIWRKYHEELTGSDSLTYDEHGNAFGFISKVRPNYQTEILSILYEEGFRAGVRQAMEIVKIAGGDAA